MLALDEDVAVGGLNEYGFLSDFVIGFECEHCAPKHDLKSEPKGTPDVEVLDANGAALFQSEE